MISRIFRSKFWHIYIISVSGHWMDFIFKTCQNVVGISMICEFNEFFKCNFWRVFALRINCAQEGRADYAHSVLLHCAGPSRLGEECAQSVGGNHLPNALSPWALLLLLLLLLLQWTQLQCIRLTRPTGIEKAKSAGNSNWLETSVEWRLTSQNTNIRQ